MHAYDNINPRRRRQETVLPLQTNRFEIAHDMKQQSAKLSHLHSGDPHRAFDYVRDAFFPKWDRQRKWKLSVNRRLKGEHGKCYTERQTIEIGPTGTNELLLLIIHEICHAAASPCHGQRWKSRVLVAAKTAATIGLDKLAKQLQDEVIAYDNNDMPSLTQQVHDRLEGIALVGAAPPVFEQVRDYLLREYTLTEGEFRKRFPRAEKVYREACEARAQRQAAREERRRLSGSDSTTPQTAQN